MSFGPIDDLVKPCVMQPTLGRIAIIGGEGAGKTSGALRLAAGLCAPNAKIAMLSVDEGGGERFFAHIADFMVVSPSPALTARAASFINDRWPMPDVGANGVDIRVMAWVMEILTRGVGPGGVVIVDNLSSIWEAAKSQVEAMPKGEGWPTIDPVLAAFWAAVNNARCHMIMCVRAHVEAVVERTGNRRRREHDPVAGIMRNRDAYFGDIRFMLSSRHTAVVSSRLRDFNGTTVELTTALGHKIKDALGGDPWRHAGEARLADLAAPLGLGSAALAWGLAYRVSVQQGSPVTAEWIVQSCGTANPAAWTRRAVKLREEVERAAGAPALDGSALEDAAVAAGLWSEGEAWPPEWPAGALEGLALGAALLNPDAAAVVSDPDEGEDDEGADAADDEVDPDEGADAVDDEVDPDEGDDEGDDAPPAAGRRRRASRAS